MLDGRSHIILGMDGNFLLTRRVIHRHLIITLALVGVGLDAAFNSTGWQVVGWHRLGVIDAARDNRLVWITFQKVDDHLLAHAWDADGPPALTGPWVRDAHPARAVFIPLPLPVPVELHLHSTVSIGPDLLAHFANDNRGLRSLDGRPEGDPGRTVGHFLWRTGEMVGIV